ncbi:MAG: phytanoyl-CoA dioxygenase family protein [Rhodospirillaceae bacterium]
MPQVLTEQQLAEYHRNGFLAPIDCISKEEASRYLQICDAFERRTGESVSKHLRVRAILGLKWLLDLARGPIISGVLRDTIGPNVILFLSGFWSKAPKTGNFVSWHQDGAYNPFDRNEGATIWLALTDATENMGCMHFIPGSQTDPDVRHRETFAQDNLLSRGQTVIDVDETQSVAAPVMAGQLSVHHEMVVHGSGPNKSDRRRLGISLACVPSEAVPLSGLKSGVLITGSPGDWELNRDPAYDFDPEAMKELDLVQKAYRNPEATVLAQGSNVNSNS